MASRMWGRIAAGGLALAVVGGLSTAGPVGASTRTVTMWGNAYAFIIGGNNARLDGATIRVAEYPEITTTAGANGAYSLEVPDNAIVTPYLEYPGYYTTYLQTFHTQGRDLRQVNFQVPEMGVYRALAALTGAKIDPKTGLLEKCAIVSTFFEIKGRTFRNFNEFHDFHPHGVPGSTTTQTPVSGRRLYFNKDVVPDPNQTVSSRDGGVLWADVDTGTYKITGANPNARFASFQATCAPGRLVNANPPWGLYQLAENEDTNPAALADNRVQARQLTARVKRVDGGPKRKLEMKIKAGENVTVSVAAQQSIGHGKGLRKQSWKYDFPPGERVVKRTIKKSFKPGSMKVRVTFTDVSGNVNKVTSWLSVPSRG